jgi:hypothetical protein
LGRVFDPCPKRTACRCRILDLGWSGPTDSMEDHHPCERL